MTPRRLGPTWGCPARQPERTRTGRDRDSLRSGRGRGSSLGTMRLDSDCGSRHGGRSGSGHAWFGRRTFGSLWWSRLTVNPCPEWSPPTRGVERSDGPGGPCPLPRRAPSGGCAGGKRVWRAVIGCPRTRGRWGTEGQTEDWCETDAGCGRGLEWPHWGCGGLRKRFGEASGGAPAGLPDSTHLPGRSDTARWSAGHMISRMDS